MVFDRKAYMKEYRKNNKEYYKEKNREWYENNKEYYKDYNKEQRKEYMKIYNKEYYKNNIGYEKERHKEYRENNKDLLNEKSKEYKQTEKGLMSQTISNFKIQGIIYPDMKELYYTYKMTTNCNYCWCLLVEGNYGANRKCLDHDHNTGEPRGVICNTCNSRDVFKNC